MSIVISALGYRYGNQDPIFQNLDFSVAAGDKVSVTGNNGCGKSTLLKLAAGLLEPAEGQIYNSSKPYYIPQHVGGAGMSVAAALGIDRKLSALHAISAGSVAQEDYDTLCDDWEVEQRCRAALDRWNLGKVNPDTPMDLLSGGEKTRVFLSGLTLHDPKTVLLDEPTNHLDMTGRRLLYDWIANTKASVVVVSHDITLLDLLYTTYELSPKGLRLYGGNYSFYRQQKEVETALLAGNIEAGERSLRMAKIKAQEVKQRQDRRDSLGERHKDQLPRIQRKTTMNRGQKTGAKLQGKHGKIIEENREKLEELRSKRDPLSDLKIDFDDANLHEGKVLVEIHGVNHEYTAGHPLWAQGLDLSLLSGDRLHITGDNGSGKTTLVRIITGEMDPTQGTVKRAEFSYVYMDQEYSLVDPKLTVLQTAEKYNMEKLDDHEVKMRLHRALFPAYTWDKPCGTLSGGERMRLLLCCLMLSNHVPDVFILDEPTNNIDIRGMEILAETIREYRGTVVLISHDSRFAALAEVGKEVLL